MKDLQEAGSRNRRVLLEGVPTGTEKDDLTVKDFSQSLSTRFQTFHKATRAEYVQQHCFLTLVMSILDDPGPISHADR